MRIDKNVKANVFDIKMAKNRKNTMQGNLSSYEGKNQKEESVYSSWNANFVGKAFEKAQQLESKERIILTSANIDNTYSKEKEKLYVHVTVFDFEKVEKERD